MTGRQRMVRHLSKRMLRHYGHVLRVPRPPTRVMPLAPPDVAVAFLDFALHVISQQQRGLQVPEDEPWKHSETYIRWFYCVSHPLIVNPVIRSMRGRLEHAMQIPEVVSNPLFFSNLEGLRTDYSVFDDQQGMKEQRQQLLPLPLPVWSAACIAEAPA
ncbi:hypothetical protein MTR_4g006390 [Medicago truncatula]|uniref:Uncharacterized protein n=1 Tax=Medicago truncatula TaxID=3880 RepID=G7JD69_MEDTR|nr:hypothetical protein MTR_4g006390 [Medicago truncatula]